MTKYISLLSKYFLIIIFTFVVIESLSRVFVWIVTKDYKTFTYGFNKNIKIDIFYLKKLDIQITDLNLINQVTLNNKLNYDADSMSDNKSIWTFGGSTTRGNSCGDNSSSWPAQLSKINPNIKIENFAEDGIDSEKSLFYLRQSVLNKRLPKIIIWAHKFNEINVIYQGVKLNKHKIEHIFSNPGQKKITFVLLKIDATFKSNFLSYKIFENFFLTVNRKIIRYFGKDRVNKNLSNKDFEYASINFKLNTLKAIKLSKENNIQKFIIVSLPSRVDFEEKMKDKFFIHYYKRIKEIKKDSYVSFIDLSNDKKIINEENIFCDVMHKTLKGNFIVAKSINSYLNN